MQALLRWLKTHLVIVASAAVILAALAVLFGVVNQAMTGFEQRLAARSNTLEQIEGFLNREVTIPSEDADQPTRQVRMTVNQASVDALKTIFQRMNGGYDELFQMVVGFNRHGLNASNRHEPMLEDLFPGPTGSNTRYNARGAYQEAIARLYNRVLNAGQPPAQSQIDQRLAEVQQAYLRSKFGASADDPQLARRKAQTRVEMLIDRARSIRVYAAPAQFGGDESRSGLFDLAGWPGRAELPTMSQLWQGQMELWIQQDLAQAVRQANTPRSGSNLRPSVLVMPVKRVLKISVDDTYFDSDATGPSRASSRGRPMDAAYGRSRPPRGGRDGDEAQATVQRPRDLTSPLPMDYRHNPTGRVSNRLFDVRMARMTVIVDSTQIPRLLNAIARVNFMTPIVESVSEVNQKAHLSNGYVYGDGVDVVQLALRIETLWLRPWTAGHFSRASAQARGEEFDPGLMPDIIRVRRGLPPRDPDFTPQADRGDNRT
ncbi:MAG: hypothetical protein GVY28_08885 [Alphaproteobacteria bacterium]|nr:hypothetical protein [Alphaproteobacteria bacterium]